MHIEDSAIPLYAGFEAFVLERHRIYLRREDCPHGPWTTDPVLRSFHFCNVYRELDRTTVALRRLTEGYGPEQWFALLAARLLNTPDGFEAAWHAVNGCWYPTRFVDGLDRARAHGLKVFGPAYMVTTHGVAQDKARYISEKVLTPAWRARDEIRPEAGDHLKWVHHRLMGLFGVGSFIAAQVVADIKNTPGNPLEHAPDWWVWCAPGPGSLQGLSRVAGLDPVRSGWALRMWPHALRALRQRLGATLQRHGLPPICAQDVQNCLCEYDKYLRIQGAEAGRKRRYTPTT